MPATPHGYWLPGLPAVQRGARCGSQAGSRSQAGFTLVEVLIAIALLAVMAAFAFRGLNGLLDARAAVTTESRKWHDVAQMFAVMEEDVVQAVGRPVRGVDLSVEPALLLRPDPNQRFDSGVEGAAGEEAATTAGPAAGVAAIAPLWFTRLGATAGEASPPQRIGYRLHQGSIERVSWPAPDRAPTADVVVSPMGVAARAIRFRCLRDGTNWVDMWPVVGVQADQLPRALEVTLTLESGETVMRRFSLR